MDGESRGATPAPRRWSRVRWAAWGSMALAALFAVVTVLVVSGAVLPLDEWVIRSARPGDVWGEAQVRLAPWVPRLRPTMMLLLLAATSVTLSARRRSWTPAVLGLVLACVSTVFLLLVKLLVARPDPHGGLAASGGSYPSGHMVAVVVCLGGCGLLLGPRTRWWGWLVTLAAAGLLGTALVVTATHWPSDVVGGALLGLAVLTATGWVSGTRAGTAGARAPRGRRRTGG
jgi:membrane-associated phospholipid phosphatase